MFTWITRLTVFGALALIITTCITKGFMAREVQARRGTQSAFTAAMLAKLFLPFAVEDPEQGAPAPPAIGQAAPATAPASNYAAFCAQYGSSPKPEQAIDILDRAGAAHGTPVPALASIWCNESGCSLEGYDFASGNCPVTEELARRDAAKGTNQFDSLLKMGRALGWTARYGENLERMTCSCPSRDPDTGQQVGYAGCCGPFQFSAAEIADTAIAQRLDPLSLCGGAFIASWQLRKHYEKARRRGYDEGRAWAWSIRRYAGGADNPCKYDVHGNYKGGCKYLEKTLGRWQQFYEWHQQGSEVLRRNVAGLAVQRMRKLAKRRIAHGLPPSN